MKAGIWLKILLLSACLTACNTEVLTDDQELATKVAVQTGNITQATLHRYVLAYGTVEPEPATGGKPSASSKIAAPLTGIHTHIHCEEGQKVKKGDLLFELDTRSADALIAKAQVAVEFSQKNFARKQQLNAADNLSRKLYDEAELLLQSALKDLANAKIQRELLQIKAPFSRTVAVIHFKVGEAVGINTIVAELIDLERLDIAIRVPSLEAALLHVGQAVDITTDSAAGTDLIPAGKLAFIGAQIDPLTDTVLVRATLGQDLSLRPGQFLRVRVVVKELHQRLAVPIESLVTRDGVSMIAVVEGDRAKLKIIKPGLRDGKLIEISGDDIQAGMTIVTQGVYGLPPEMQIRILK